MEERQEELILDWTAQLILRTVKAAAADGMQIGMEQAANDTNNALMDVQDKLMTAWGIIANVSGGNWDVQSQEWRDAAIRFRDVDLEFAVLDEPQDMPDSIFLDADQ